MTSESKVARLILKLTRATVENEIKWKFSDPPHSLKAGTDDVIPIFLECQYKLQRVALYERRYKTFDPETESLYWTGDLGFAFLDWRGEILWDHKEFSSSLRNLFDIARESAAGVDELLDDLLDG